MALDFPNAPTLNQTYAGPSGVLWSWDGAKWVNATVTGGYAPVQSPVFTGDPQAPTQPATDADTSVATTAFVQTAVGGANHNIGRNLLHNPLFNVAQRGGGPWTTTGYTVDRWRAETSLDTISITQIALTGGVAGDEGGYACIANAFVGNAGASAYNQLSQRIEEVRRLAGKTVTVSFNATPNSGSPKLGVSLDQYFGTGGSPSAFTAGTGQSVTVPTGWGRYSLTFTVPTAVGKTLGTNNDSATFLNFWFSGGASLNSRTGTVGVQSGTMNIWGVQLEIGSVATPLEKPDPRYDLANCQRFYQTGLFLLYAYQLAGSPVQTTAYLSTTMRASPTFTAGSDLSGNVGARSLSAYSPSAGTCTATATATNPVVLNVQFSASADL